MRIIIIPAFWYSAVTSASCLRVVIRSSSRSLLALLVSSSSAFEAFKRYYNKIYISNRVSGIRAKIHVNTTKRQYKTGQHKGSPSAERDPLWAWWYPCCPLRPRPPPPASPLSVLAPDAYSTQRNHYYESIPCVYVAYSLTCSFNAVADSNRPKPPPAAVSSLSSSLLRTSNREHRNISIDVIQDNQ